jgi:acetyltransferase-like isoleucine patch superfamily enzyme
MRKSLFSRIANRILHLVARFGPGSRSLRPKLHRWRGVKIGPGVFIGDDVYIDGEYPELVEIEEDASVSMRAIIVAHERTPGRIIIEKEVFIGPNVVIYCTGGTVLRIGRGAVVAGGSVVTRSIAPGTMVAPPPTRAVAYARVPFTIKTSMKEFLAGLSPISRGRPK